MNATYLATLGFIIGILLVGFSVWYVHNRIQENYLQDDPKLNNLRSIFEHFFKQDRHWEEPLGMLNQRNVMDEIKLYRGNKSYTINKEKVYLCLKNNKGEYYEDNDLIFVLAHELAHVLTDEIGHTKKFHIIFEALLVQLAHAHIYNPDINMPSDYCEDGDSEIEE